MGIPPVPVMVARVASKDVPLQVQAIGTVEAFTTVSVKSQVSAELIEVHFTEGQEVEQGALLFTLDSRPFEVDLRRAEANLARDTAQKKQAEANLARDIAQAKNASIQEQRYRALFEKGVTAKETYDAAHASSDALEAAVNADKAAIDNASEAIRADLASIDTAKITLGYCTIRSPIAGRTGSVLLQRGNLVKANDTAAMVVIYRIQPVRVTFSVPEQYLSEVRRFMASGRVKVVAVIPGEDGSPIQGELTFIDNAVNSATGTVTLKGTFANSGKRLWPGQFVNVALTLSTQAGAIVVPTEAVQTGQQGVYVFVVRPDLSAELRPVTPGRTIRGQTVIEKGLQVGESVVTDGQLRLIPGAKVQIKQGVYEKSGRSS
jgi:multidrug efflux system membrane fusion protein